MGVALDLYPLHVKTGSHVTVCDSHRVRRVQVRVTDTFWFAQDFPALALKDPRLGNPLSPWQKQILSHPNGSQRVQPILWATTLLSITP